MCIRCVDAGVAAVVGGRGWWRQVSGGGRHHGRQRRRGGFKVAAAMTHDSDTHECVRGYCRFVTALKVITGRDNGHLQLLCF